MNEARWAFLKTLLPLLDRAARERDTGKADALAAEAAKTDATSVNAAAAIAALDGLFPCP